MRTEIVSGSHMPVASLMELAEIQMFSPKLQRWSKYFEMSPGTSPQPSGSHSYSLALIVPILFHHLPNSMQMDQARLMRAVLVHDLGEGLLGRDVLFDLKSDDKDWQEYLAWHNFIVRFNPTVQASLKEDFLLQFCLTHGDSEFFDQEAKEIMAELRRRYHDEAVAFQVLETYEYLIYAIRQYRDRDHRVIFTDVVNRQLPRLEEWSRQMPGGIGEFWTEVLSEWCRTELTKLNGQAH